ncbi:MAG: flagellar basal body P-ring protein FlgI [Vicinamibacterales bacterium]
MSIGGFGRRRRQQRRREPPHRRTRAERRAGPAGERGVPALLRHARARPAGARLRQRRPRGTRGERGARRCHGARQDPGTVVVRVPEQYRGAVPDLMARIELLPVDTDAPARVVINERSGTVVVGGAVRSRPGGRRPRQPLGAHQHEYEVSHASALSRTGDTVVVPNVDVNVQEQSARLVTLEEGTTLDAVVAALNALGATPRDIIAIMQALKAAGALRADIVIL